jgi:ABC-type transporter MlaC component
VRRCSSRSTTIAVSSILLIAVLISGCQTNSSRTDALDVAGQSFANPAPNRKNSRRWDGSNEPAIRPEPKFPRSETDDIVIKEFQEFLQCRNKEDFEGYLVAYGRKGLFYNSAMQRIANQGNPSNEYLVEFVQQMIRAFNLTLDSVPPHDSSERVKKLEILRTIIGNVLNFKAMEKYVLGAYKNKATTEQLNRFSNIYRQMILGGYLLTSMYGWRGSIDLHGARSSTQYTNDVLVELRLSPGSRNNRVYVRFRKQERGLGVKIIDIIINQTISILTTLRGDYSSILEHDGIEGLIKRLNTKLEASRYANSTPTN